MSNLCSQCGAPLGVNAQKCEYCGTTVAKPVEQQNPITQKVYVQQPPFSPERANLPIRNKMIAGILAIILGYLGVHKFYLGETKKGLLYLLFCWTYIPGILGLIEGIMILSSTDENFQNKYNCRLQ